MFEISLRNNKRYRNPFDFDEVTLHGRFASPSGKETDFLGFHDGDGNGGQTGSVWKLRFMPNELGTWTYLYKWSDGTGSDTGKFQVVASNQKGPLQSFAGNPRHFQFANGDVFYPRAYYLSSLFFSDNANLWKHAGVDKYFHRDFQFNLVVTTFWQGELGWQAGIQPWGPGYEYNGFYPVARKGGLLRRLPHRWRTDYARYDLKSWRHLDQVLAYLTEKEIVWYNFDGIYPNEGGALHRQTERDQRNFVKYYVARIAPYPYILHNLAFEYEEFLSAAQVDAIARLVKELDAFGHPVSVHGLGVPRDFDWADYTIVQIDAGRAATAKDAFEVVVPVYRERKKPIACIECSWEGEQDGKLDEVQVRHGTWGQILGGSFPVYAESFRENDNWLYGDGGAFPYVEIAHNFMQRTKFWMMMPDPDVISGNADAVAMADRGRQYLVYLQSGGSVDIDLSDASGTFRFSWLNPRDGTRSEIRELQGGKRVSVNAADQNDWVLHIYRP